MIDICDDDETDKVIHICDDDEQFSTEKLKNNEPLNLVLHSRNTQQSDLQSNGFNQEHGASGGTWASETRDNSTEWRSLSAEGKVELFSSQRWPGDDMASVIKRYLTRQGIAGNLGSFSGNTDSRDWSCNTERSAPQNYHIRSPESAIGAEDATSGRGNSDVTWSAKAMFSPMYRDSINGSTQDQNQRWSRELMNAAIQNYLSKKMNGVNERSYSPKLIDLTTRDRVSEWSPMTATAANRSRVGSEHSLSPEIRPLSQDESDNQVLPSDKSYNSTIQTPQSCNSDWLQNTEYSYQKTISPENIYSSTNLRYRWPHDEREHIIEAVPLAQRHKNFSRYKHPCFKCGQGPPELHRDTRICSDPSHFFDYHKEIFSETDRALITDIHSSAPAPGSIRTGLNKSKRRRKLNRYKDRKSYCAEIAGILLKKGSLLLAEIYDEYENSGFNVKRPSANSWKNSIRHNLSLHDCFVKVPTRDKGFNRWAVHPQWVPHFQRLVSGGNLSEQTALPDEEMETYQLEIDSDSDLGENDPKMSVAKKAKTEPMMKNINEADTTTIIDVDKIKREPDANDNNEAGIMDDNDEVEILYDSREKKRRLIQNETKTADPSGGREVKTTECCKIIGQIEIAYDTLEEKQTVVKDEAKKADPSEETEDEVKTMDCEEINREVDMACDTHEENENAVDNERKTADPTEETEDESKTTDCEETNSKGEITYKRDEEKLHAVEDERKTEDPSGERGEVKMMGCEETNLNVKITYETDARKEPAVKDERKTVDTSGETGRELKTIEYEETNREVEITYERHEEKQRAVDNETRIADPIGVTGDELKTMNCDEICKLQIACDRHEENQRAVDNETKTADPSGENGDEVKMMVCEETDRKVEITCEKDEEKQRDVEEETKTADPSGETGDEVKKTDCDITKDEVEITYDAHSETEHAVDNEMKTTEPSRKSENDKTTKCYETKGETIDESSAAQTNSANYSQ